MFVNDINLLYLSSIGHINGNWVDHEYLKLVQDVLKNGVLKPTRAKIDDKNISAYSVFGRQARFSLRDGFPILTTKKINFRAIVHELIWFLRGDSNIKYLRDNNVHIWDAWASPEGELGYGVYGSLWRQFPFDERPENFKKHFPNYNINACGEELESLTYWVEKESKDNKPIHITGWVDQIKELIHNIEKIKEDPTVSCGRRLIVTAWHPYYVDKVGLPPCHCFMQFNVTGDKLSCHLYQRSCDLFLGVPFNITSYSLLTHIIADQTGLIPHEFIHTYGDLHIYENHLDQIKQQFNRSPYKLPKLYIEEGVNINEYEFKDFTLEGYQHHPALRGEVAV